MLALRSPLPLRALGVEDDETVPVEVGSASMEAAIGEARRQLPALQSRWPHRRSTERFLVKYPFPPTNEHMWVMVTELTLMVAKGTLSNEPRSTPQLKFGQQVTVDLTRISDWMILDNGDQVAGGFTLEVLGH